MPSPLCLFLVALSLVVGACGNRTETDTSAFKRDSNAVATLSQIAATINSSKTISPEQFAALKRILEKYPNAADVVTAYKGALIVRGDWTVLETLLRAKPASDLSPEDRILLGRVLVRVAKYDEAIVHLEKLVSETPNSSDARSMLAEAYNAVGEFDKAGAQLDAVWPQIIAEKRFETMSLRGLIHLNQNQLQKAEETFLATLAVDRGNLSAASNLSRVYARLGNEAKAEEYRKLAVRISDDAKQRDQLAFKRVEKIYAVEAAWKAKRYDEIVTLVTDLLTTSTDPNEKAVLYTYLFESHRALGNTAEAEKARAEVLKLQQK